MGTRDLHVYQETKRKLKKYEVRRVELLLSGSR